MTGEPVTITVPGDPWRGRLMPNLGAAIAYLQGVAETRNADEISVRYMSDRECLYEFVAAGATFRYRIAPKVGT